MASKAKTVRASDLITKRVRAPDGSVIQLKVVQSESPTLMHDLMAAAQSNIRRVRAEELGDR